MTSQHSSSQPLLFVGIDWADREHEVAWIDSQHNQGQESSPNGSAPSNSDSPTTVS
jgi:hypothetical protein